MGRGGFSSYPHIDKVSESIIFVHNACINTQRRKQPTSSPPTPRLCSVDFSAFSPLVLPIRGTPPFALSFFFATRSTRFALFPFSLQPAHEIHGRLLPPVPSSPSRPRKQPSISRYFIVLRLNSIPSLLAVLRMLAILSPFAHSLAREKYSCESFFFFGASYFS